MRCLTSQQGVLQLLSQSHCFPLDKGRSAGEGARSYAQSELLCSIMALLFRLARL